MAVLPFSIIRVFRQWRGETLTKRLVPPQFAQTIGEHTYGAPDILAWSPQPTLHIGKFCSIADGVTFVLGGNHRTDWVSTYPFAVFARTWPGARKIKGHPADKGDIVVGNDVWIAYGATILSGVKIGDGAVIGAKAVVAKDVPPYAIVVGSPAQVIKYRFSTPIIKKLLKIKWWDWPTKKIANYVGVINSNNIKAFLTR